MPNISLVSSHSRCERCGRITNGQHVRAGIRPRCGADQASPGLIRFASRSWWHRSRLGYSPPNCTSEAVFAPRLEAGGPTDGFVQRPRIPPLRDALAFRNAGAIAAEDSRDAGAIPAASTSSEHASKADRRGFQTSIVWHRLPAAIHPWITRSLENHALRWLPRCRRRVSDITLTFVRSCARWLACAPCRRCGYNLD